MRKQKSRAVASAVSGLKLASKILKGRGTIGLYMYAVAAEARTLAAARRRLFEHLYRGTSLDILNHFPDSSDNAVDLSNCYRTEYQWVLETKDQPLEDLLADPLQIDWWGVASPATGLAPWPDDIDKSSFDEEATIEGIGEMISGEIDWYSGRLKRRPSFDHLWADLPPRARKSDQGAIERFNQAVRTISNPIGKSNMRTASKSYHLIWQISRARVKRVRQARFWTSVLSQRRL
jgi:hypothetical protein